MEYIYLSANPRIEPVYFVIAGIIALLAGVITEYYRRQGRMSKVQSIVVVFLTAYIFLVFASTVFSRTSISEYSYELIPFWSYWKIWKGSKYLFWEDVFNVIMLLPVGILVPVVIKDCGKGKRSCVFRRVLLIGFLTSLTIELLQLLLKRGLFEFDDMFHNTIGAAIGYWIYRKCYVIAIQHFDKRGKHESGE